jgi:predicted dithiol-disulfide oxidoreductase (DUF899 family)
MVRIDKQYVFDGPAGKASLLDLFAGGASSSYHSCSTRPGTKPFELLDVADTRPSRPPARAHTACRGVPAPRAPAEPYQRRMGWTVPWYSSFGSDFNYDFHVTHDEAVAPVEYNYLDKHALLAKGEPWFTAGESHGLSVFLRDGESIFHTYSTYARGCDLLVGTFNSLDLTPLGRQEDWEEPSGRSDGPFMHWVRRHDRYAPRRRARTGPRLPAATIRA